MIKKIFYAVHYLAITASLILYSLLIRIDVAYGYTYPQIFNDPKEMGMNIHYGIVYPYALVLNWIVFLPISFLLMLYLVIKKDLHRDTVILCLLNIVSFYLITLGDYGPMTWLAD
ncbi:MAG: hypothetical protein GX102_02945 [Porphyromonadaceae bacterium]|jgi:hypothetical protein|nr:hypothetical protein [Porphyromonadaceae bacterium]